jgi:hypothetical protein
VRRGGDTPNFTLFLDVMSDVIPVVNSAYQQANIRERKGRKGKKKKKKRVQKISYLQ